MVRRARFGLPAYQDGGEQRGNGVDLRVRDRFNSIVSSFDDNLDVAGTDAISLQIGQRMLRVLRVAGQQWYLPLAGRAG